MDLSERLSFNFKNTQIRQVSIHKYISKLLVYKSVSLLFYCRQLTGVFVLKYVIHKL